jgi:hypothetical protein
VITEVAAFNVPHALWVTGGLGVLITGLEGMLQLNQFQQNWIAYRSTCESLKHEKYVYLGKASPYANVADPHALLPERIESRCQLLPRGKLAERHSAGLVTSICKQEE